MVQDIYPHIFKNEYDLKTEAKENDILLCIVNGKILIHLDSFEKNEIVFPKVKDIKKSGYLYLFTIDTLHFFLLNQMLDEKNIPEGFGYVEERSLRKEGIRPKESLFAAITGKHLSDWYRDSQYCGRCGHKMVHSTKERAMVCEKCHNTVYPRIMPAVIVGVKNGDKLLITRYRTGFRYNALIAGFTEIGETVEETVQREVMEEAGIHVKNIQYYKSQPWGTANDILLGFFCDVDGDDAITMDPNELKYADWVQREEIELQPGEFSLTNEMMKLFKEHKV